MIRCKKSAAMLNSEFEVRKRYIWYKIGDKKLFNNKVMYKAKYKVLKD